MAKEKYIEIGDDKFLTLDQVMDLTDFSKSKIYRLAKQKGFPTKGVYGWSLKQIQSWTEEQYGYKLAA